jgi:hypothetical protein
MEVLLMTTVCGVASCGVVAGRVVPAKQHDTVLQRQLTCNMPQHHQQQWQQPTAPTSGIMCWQPVGSRTMQSTLARWSCSK